MIDNRFKKIDYNRVLNTSRDIKLLLLDLIKIMRYYKEVTKLQDNYTYKMKNRYNRFKATKYLNELKKDFKLWYSIYKFKKFIIEK
jgi:hypothetical protein